MKGAARFPDREEAWLLCLEADRRGAENASLMASRAGEWACYAEGVDRLPPDLREEFEESSLEELEREGFSPIPPGVWKEIWTGRTHALAARVGQTYGP
jgi:hypothetical protein